MTQVSGNGTLAPALPLFYKSIVPLHSGVHAALSYRARADYAFAARTEAIPVAAEEFPLVQVCYPIVFSAGEAPAPMALVGAPGGRNRFVDENGNWRKGVYIPAYVRRYPFIMAKVAPDRQEPGLCFDAESGYFADAAGERLFGDDGATELTQGALRFCADFERAMQGTCAFVSTLDALDLLIEAKAEIHGGGKPVAVGGFRMVSDEKLKALRAEECRGLVKDGSLGLVYAHLFSLKHIEGLFAGM